MGPARTAPRKATGISVSTVFRRAVDSIANSASLAKVGELWVACSTDSECLRRF